jgi:hypothetical protein
MFSSLRPIGPLAAALALLAGGLSGCATSADLSYSEYQFGPGYRTERVHERRLYADTDQGFGSESCQGVAGRQVNEFGELVVRDTVVCDDTALGDIDEP